MWEASAAQACAIGNAHRVVVSPAVGHVSLASRSFGLAVCREATALLRVRESSEARRYQEFHQIDYADLSIYDLVIDTDEIEPSGVVAQILARFEPI